MSSYYDDDDRERRRSHRRSRPVYEEEIIERRTTKPPRDGGNMELVRRRGSDDSVEEIRRDFPPGEGMYIQRRTTKKDKYAPRRRSADYDYDDDESYYSSRRGEGRRFSRRENRRYEADSESDSPSPPRQRRKSLGEQALAALGLGGAAAALTGKKERERSESRDRGYDDRRRSRSRRGRYDDDDDDHSSYYRSRSVDRGGADNKQRIIQAAKAAAAAGAITAWRNRKEPGGFQGQGKRILTAAIGAAGIDGVLGANGEHKTRNTIEATLGGLAGNRLINGPRQSSRSRSRARDGKSDLGGVASAAGLAAIAGQAFNEYRSRSRGRQNTIDRDDSPNGRPRSRSVSERIQGGVDAALAKLGLSNKKEEPRGRSRSRYDSEDDDDNYRARPRGGGAEEKNDGSSSSSSSSSDTDSYDSDKEIKKQKKLKRNTLITAGLASVATIHAVANVHGSMEKAKKRHKDLASGKITQEQAKKKKTKALLQDAVAVGIAGIGIQSAFSELKELKEGRSEYVHACKRLEEMREHRKLKMRDGKYQNGDEDDYDDDRREDSRRRHSDDGPYYYDDNPYGSHELPRPPMSSRPYDNRDRYY